MPTFTCQKLLTTNKRMNVCTPPGSDASFKSKKPFALRKQEASEIREKYPDKIPLIVERYSKEKALPRLEKCKFLVPKEISVSQFVSIIRLYQPYTISVTRTDSVQQLQPTRTVNRMCLNCSQAFYLLINNRTVPSMSSSLAEIYRDDVDKDGYLYMSYASHEMFG